MKIWLLLFTTSCFFWSLPSWAIVLGKDEIAQRYFSTNLQLDAARKRMVSAQNLEVEAGRKLFPSLSLVGAAIDQQVPTALTGGLDISPPKIYSLALQVEQPLYLGGKIWSGWELRRKSARTAEWSFKLAQLKGVYATLKMALSLRIQQQMLKVVNQSKGTQKQFLEIVKQRQKRGAAKLYEKFQAEADLLAYDAQIFAIEKNIENLKLSLKKELQYSEDEVLEVGRFGEPPQDATSLNQALQQALRQNPELKIAELNEELAKVNRDIDMGDHRPTVSLGARMGFQNLHTDDLFKGESKQREIRLSLSIPLFSGLTSLYQKRSHMQLIGAAQSELRSLENDVQTSVKNIFKDLKRSEQKLVSAREWRNKSELALKEGIKNYRVGITSSLVVVQLQKARELAAKSYLTTLEEKWVVYMDWLDARGLNYNNKEI